MPGRFTILMSAGQITQVRPRASKVIVAQHLPSGPIDAKPGALDHGYMSVTIQASPRRSTRVFHKMRVHAKGRGYRNKKFTETCETQVVNAHGGLLLLKQEVNLGDMLVLIHPESLEEQECRIVYLGEPNDRGQRVGIEFLTPAPHFWGLDLGDNPVAGSDGDASSLN